VQPEPSKEGTKSQLRNANTEQRICNKETPNDLYTHNHIYTRQTRSLRIEEQSAQSEGEPKSQPRRDRATLEGVEGKELQRSRVAPKPRREAPEAAASEVLKGKKPGRSRETSEL
jgi:hypothetical protein